MALEVVFLSGADADFQNIYEHRGDRFYRQVNATLALLSQNPALGPKKFADCRRVLVAQTPYGMYYSVHGKRIFTTGIVDLRQDPEIILWTLRSRM